MRAARAHLGPALRGVNKAPGQMPPQPFSDLLVACEGAGAEIGVSPRFDAA